MKKQLLMALAAVVLSLLSIQNFAQAPSVGTAAEYAFLTAPAPTLGTATDYVLFTTVGAVGNTGISQITGNVGTNSGAITIYVNVNGVLHTSDGSSAQCAADLLIAYNQLSATIPTFFPAPLLGNGQVLNAGVYQTTGATTLSNELILDAQNDPNAVFIIQIEGPFSTAANSSVTLVNDAMACNVFWKIEGLVDMASGTTMRGTVIANNAAINLNAGVTLEGRALSTAGAVNATGVLAYTPIGCGSPVLMGPTAPDLVSAACYAIFSSNGPVTNAGISYVTGDIGTNVGLTTGFNPLFVTGMIHPIPDGSTAAAAADLLNAYNFLNVIPYDIELMYPAQFGNNLVLTPHTYILNAATTLTDTLYLNGGGQADAVFVIQIFGALSTSTHSKVILTNGTLPENVYWNVNGAVSINDYSIFKGTVIANNGAVNLATGVNIDGRAFTTTGAIETAAVTVTMPPGCGSALPPEIVTGPEDQVACEGDSVSFTVSATGSGLEYQWRKGTENLIDGLNISGSTTATLTIDPASLSDAATDYNVVVTGTYSPAVTSENVSLTVETAPEITTQPADQIASVGGSASFSVLATGDGLTYQWRKGIIALADGGNISGATSAMLTINPVGLADAALDYNVVITGNCAPDAISDNASLTISVSPIIITEPENQVVCEGGSVSFSVVALGDGLIYQWRKGTENLIDGLNISGSATATLTIDPASLSDAATDYNVVVTGTYLPAATSENVSLTVETAPEITTQPADQIASVGGSASFSVLATGDGLTYQWRKGIIALADGGNISGATSAMLTINPVGLADAALDYNVVITGNCAPDAISDNASLTISVSPIIITEPENQVVCEGGLVSFSVVALGDGLIYQWRKGTENLIDGLNISGSATATLTIDPASLSDAATDYNVVVTGTYLPAATSENVSLTVETAPEITTQPADQIASVGGSASFSVLATGDGLTYQWRKGIIALADGGNISGATSAMLTINPVGLADAALDYNVVITGNCAPDAISDNASLTISVSPIIITEPENQVVCEGGLVSFSVVALGDGLIYQWRKGTENLIDGLNISGSATATLTIDPASLSDAATDYNVVVTGTYLPAAVSVDVSLTVQLLPANVFAGDDATVYGTNPFTLSAATAENYSSLLWTTTGDGTFEYETDLNPTYTPGITDPGTTVTLCLHVEQIAPCDGLPYVDCMDLFVQSIQLEPVASAGEDQGICENQVAHLVGDAQNYSSVLWSGGDGVFSAPNSLVTDYTPGPDDISAGTAELCLTAAPVAPATGSAVDCLTLTIQALPNVFAGDNDAICQGSTYELLSATAQNAGSVLWSGGDGVFTPSANVLNPIYTPGPQDISDGSVELCLTAQSELPCTLESVDCMTLTITTPPSTDAGIDLVACQSDGFVMLNGVVNNAASAEWNSSSIDGFFEDENEATTTYYFGADDISNGGATLCLTATAIYPCSEAATDCLTLTIIADPTANAGPDAVICEGDNYLLSEASVTDAGNIEWETSGDGTFDNLTLLNPLYTPGSADIANGTVQLCINAEATQNCSTIAKDCMILTIATPPQATLGGDLSLSCADYDIPNGKWLPVVLTNTITGDYDSILWTTDGDGTFSDPTAVAPLYNPGLADIWKGDIELCVTVQSVEACQTSDTKCMMLYIPQQLIYFDVDGWWGISSYLDTDLPLVKQVMDPLVLIPGSQHLVTMIDKQGKYFWAEPVPTQATLGNWMPIGYKAKIKNPPACLPIYGDSLLNQTFTVSGAFTFLPVLTNVPVAIDELLAGHLNDILLIYDWSNKVLWTPQAADFTELYPGRAYLMVNRVATGAYTIEYPDFVPDAPHFYPATPPKSAVIHNSPWQQEINTAIPHIMLFDDKAMNKLTTGDILGVFDSQGNCHGQAEYGTEGVYSLIAMGHNDQLRDERAGFETGEKMFVRKYNATTGEQQAVTFVYNTDFPSSDGLFAANGASQVIDIIETATNVNDDLSVSHVTIYPNPANEVINIASDYDLRKVTLINYVGQTVFSQAIDGNDFQINVSGFVNGMYFVRIETAQGNVVTKPISIQ